MALWFRFYTDSLHKAKIQNLPPELFKHWVNLICIAKEFDQDGGTIPDLAEVAFGLRVSEAETGRILSDLQSRKLIDLADETLVMHDWQQHQYVSDNSTKRVKKHRSKKVKRFSNGEETVQSRADTEQIQIQKQSRAEKNTAPSALAREFSEQFWPKVWCKVGRDEAERAYKKARTHVSCEELVQATIDLGPLIVEQAQAQGRSAVHPATWLNQGRWADEPSAYTNGMGPKRQLFGRALQRQQMEDEIAQLEAEHK